MKKFLSILMLVAALVVPGASRAQLQLTVADGTTTNSYVPIYGLWADDYTRSQMVYPSTDLVLMTGGMINGLTFYCQNTSLTWSGASFQVKIAEVASTTLSSWSTASTTTVYSGSLSTSSTGLMVITFTTPYVYQGGNLLIEFAETTTGTYQSSYWYGISSTGSSSGGYSSSGASSVSFSQRNFLPKVTFDYAPANTGCGFPINLAISGVDSNEATLSWSDTTGASSWRVYWAPADTPALIDSVDVNDTTYTFTGLNANTLYNVSVMTVCDTSNSIVMRTSFRTLCGITTAPFTEGFEGRTTGDTPYCWTQVATGTSGSGTFPSIYNYATNARTGNAYFEFESTSGQTEVAALPSVDNITNLRLRFYAACTNHNFVLEAGVMEDTTFVVVDTVQLTTATSFSSNAYHEYTVYYNNYNGTSNRMAMRVTAAGSYTLMIDDLTVEEIPACPDPTYFVVDSVGTDWAALSWVENGSASEWIIEYDTVPFTPGATATANSVTASDTYITLTDLDTGYTYYVYMHADCGGDTSNNVFLQFNTLAGDPATVPYSCGFEDANTNGWEFANGTQTNHWMVGNATNHGGSKAMYVTNNGTDNAYTNSSISYTYAYRIFNLTEPGEYAYSYDWKCQGESHYYDFSRAFITPATEEFVGGTIPGNSTNAFSTYACPANWFEITAQTGATPNTMAVSSSWTTTTGTFNITTPGLYKMVFVWANDGSGGSQPPMAVDNVSLNRNTCPSPTNLTVNVSGDTANFAWTDALGSNWDLVYVPEGTAPSDDAAIAVSSTSYEATDLDGGFYDAYVRTNCGSDDVSLWVGPVNFSVGVTVMNMATSGVDTLHTCTAIIYDDGGATGSYSMSCDATLIVIPSQEGSVFYVNGTSYTESTWDYIYIYEGIGTNGTVLWHDNISGTEQRTIDPFYVEGPITITFHSDGSVVEPGFQINVSCVTPPNCSRPETFNLVSLLADSAEFSWTDNTNSNWGIEYGPAGFTRGNENDTSIHWALFTDTTGWITDLTPSVNYDFYLVALCDDTSWARQITARTPCLAISDTSLPYHYGFEGSSIDACWRLFNIGNTTVYPSLNSTYHAEGSKSLYFYGYSNTYCSYAVMPMFETPLNQLMM